MQCGILADEATSGTVTCTVDELPLLPGTYYVQVGCGTGGTPLDIVPRAARVDMLVLDVYGTGQLPEASYSLIAVRARWQLDSRD